jgi:hypothetical protein
MRIRDRSRFRVLGVMLAAVTALGMTGCNQEDPVPADGEFEGNSAPYAQGTPTEENRVMYEGQYNQEFIDESANYLGQQVTISGEVSRSLAPVAFAIAGPADPMLIVAEQEIPAVNEGEFVEITGTMRGSFSVTEVEGRLGVDPEDELYSEFEGEDYVVATEAQVTEQQ